MTQRAGEPIKRSDGLRKAMIPGSSTLIVSLFITCFILTPLYAQEDPGYGEISVYLSIPKVGGTEVEAVIKGQELYIAVTDLFDFLKIKNDISQNMESVAGFFITPDAPYTITRSPALITYQGKRYTPDPGDIVRTEYNLYLKSTLFGEIFGLECQFNFRNLSVTVNSQQELPVIREMKLLAMRRNLSRLQGEFEADTTIERSYPRFKAGMADWSAVVSEEINGQTDGRFNLALGAMILGGEATASLNYNTRDPFSEKQQYYHWRYVNNDFSPLRQISAGKIRTNTLSTLYNPVVGVQLTNTPTTYRRSFGSYTLSDHTEPGWTVELYVNNVLVDYITADASGFFSFEVPLIYGNTTVNLKFYGPWGEERTREQNINIPFNYLPVNTLEYNISAGVVEDDDLSRFTRAALNYGVTRKLTVGGGVEYLSSLTTRPVMPFANASVSITNNLLLSAEYAHRVKSTANLSYRLPSSIQMDLKYTLYDKEQEAISFNYREERKATLSLPLKVGKFRTYNRFSLYQIILPASDYTTGEWLFSGSLFGVNTNLTTYAIVIGDTDPYIYSNLSAALRLPAQFTVMPQMQYSYTRQEFLSGKIRVEKRFMNNSFMHLSMEHNMVNNISLFELGVRFDFSFAQAGASLWKSGKTNTLVQYARGSLIHDGRTRYSRADNRTNVGRGGITVIAFVDFNNNGEYDKGEPRAQGLNLRANGGRIIKSERDTTVRILGLEPYTTCYIELDAGSFENVAWRLPFESASVAVDPNILKTVWVPVTVAGEVSGYVRLQKEDTLNGIERILVGIKDESGKRVTRMLTEYDGYYSYFGLAPGNYTVAVDSTQMHNLGMIAEPESMPFTLEPDIEGDMVAGLDFILSMIIPVADTAATDSVATVTGAEPVITKDSTYVIIHEAVEELITITEDSWAIQLGAFRNKAYAEGFRSQIQALVDKKVEIVVENDFYKIRILDLKDRAEVDDHIDILTGAGHTELWIIRLKAMQQQLILTEKADSTLKVTERAIDDRLPDITPDMSIQLGAFRNKGYALALQNRLTATINQDVVIVEEDGYSKVRVTGFKSREEMEKIIPALGLLGMTDIWILPVKQQMEKPPVKEAAVVTDTLPGDPGLKDGLPVVNLKDSAAITRDITIEITEPPISIQAGVFNKLSEARRAQRRISSRLERPVEITEQWGRYYVIIPGFFTREETYPFYPELAGLGYSQIMIIEK